MRIKVPNLSQIVSALGGVAGITGVICVLIGVAPSSTVGQAVQGALSALLVLVTHWHASSVVSSVAKSKAAAGASGKTSPQTV
jgi:hypothetical protein